MTQDGKCALITGGSRGIGRAIALRLARSGFDVGIGFRSSESAASEVAEAAKRFGVRAHPFRANVASAAELETVVARFTTELGSLAVLVNNAAIAPLTPIDDISLSEWSEVLDTNLRGSFLLSRSALGIMREKKWGRIVNVASQAGITGGFFIGAHYAASKGGLIAMTKSFAKIAARSAPGVTVNCVAPGLITTDLTEGFPEQAVSGLIASIPMGKPGKPEDVAGVVAFLCTDEASYITGAVIPVDGGLMVA